MSRDLELMAEELTLLYGRDNAKKIMLDNKDKLFDGKDSVAYALGKRSMKFFALYFLSDMFIGDDKAELSDTHYESWQELQEMFSGEQFNKRNYLFPRGFGKTSILSTPTVIYAHCYEYSRLTVLASAVKDTATSFMVNVKEGLQSSKIERVFGKLVSNDLVNNTEKLELSNNSMIEVASTRTTLRGINYKGNRINLLILDDYQSEENTTTTDARDKHWNLFQRNALPAVEKHKHWILGFGTTQVRGDFYDRLSNDPTFTTQKAKALENIDIFRNSYWVEFRNILYSGKNGYIKAKQYYNDNKEYMEFNRIWDYFECDHLATLYFTDEDAFLQEYMLELGVGYSNLFRNIIYYDNYVEPTILVVDPATSSNKKADYTAMIIGNYDDDIIYVENIVTDKIEFNEYINTMISVLERYKAIDTVIIERQTYNGADVIALKNKIDRIKSMKYRDITFINIHQSKNKESKINSIVGDVNLGGVQFNKELKNDNVGMKQLINFKGVNVSRHDDTADALSELVSYVREERLDDGYVEVLPFNMLF